MVPAGPDWLHEIKHDGYRLSCNVPNARYRGQEETCRTACKMTRMTQTGHSRGGLTGEIQLIVDTVDRAAVTKSPHPLLGANLF
jgi:hypothetical protein